MAAVQRPQASQGTTSPQIGARSERDFLCAIRDHALLSVALGSDDPVLGQGQADLIAATGLSRPSVNALLTRFSHALLAQDADGNPTNFDDAVRWSLNPDAGVVIGARLADEAHVGISDLYGRLKEPIPPPPGADKWTADETVDWTVQTIKELIGDHARSEVVGVGVSLGGPVDQRTGRLRTIPMGETADPKWEDWQIMKVREHLERRLWDGLPIRIDNDANVNALAEHIWGAGRPSPTHPEKYAHVVFVEWGRGIGAGLILDGELYRGQGVAGEIGHTYVGAETKEICRRCGNTGCLEMTSGWEPIRKRLKFPDRRPIADEIRSALERAQRSDQDAIDAFTYAAEHFALVLGPVIHTLNPQLVIIGGDLGQIGYDTIKGPLLKTLRARTMRPALEDVTVVGASLTAHPVLQGAASLILRAPSADTQDPLVWYLREL